MSHEHDLFGRVVGFDELSGLEQTEFLLYVHCRGTQTQSATGTDLEQLRTRLGLAKGRSAQHLANHAKARSTGSFAKRSRGYALTDVKFERWHERLEGRPATRKTARILREHLEKVPVGPLKDYLEETVCCFEARHLRATIVMAWCAGFYVIRGWLLTKERNTLNAQMATWKKPVVITKIDDFESLSERVVLDTSREAGILPKSTYKILVALLDQRNSYAHPLGRSISEAVAEAFVQQVIDEIIEKFTP